MCLRELKTLQSTVERENKEQWLEKHVWNPTDTYVELPGSLEALAFQPYVKMKGGNESHNKKEIPF